MKKVSVVLSVILCLAVAAFSGCSGLLALKAPAGLHLSGAYLVWNDVKSADGYAVNVGAGNVVCNGNSVYLPDLCKYVGDYTVTVAAVKNGKIGKKATIKINAVAQKNPAVHSGELEPCVYWEPESPFGYKYNLFDGYGEQVAKANNVGTFYVYFTSDVSLIEVITRGGSVGNTLHLPTRATYTYSDGKFFDLTKLASYKWVYVSSPLAVEDYVVRTTLAKNTYTVQVKYYVMNAKGERVTGEGEWGRRLYDSERNVHWFCQNEVSGYPESAGTNASPAVPLVEDFKIVVDANGQFKLSMCDFLEGEMVVFEDVLYNGQSVLSDEDIVVREDPQFDLSTLDDYIAYYRASGANFEKFTVPAALSDGTHTIDFTFYLMTSEGRRMTENGVWGRRVTHEAGANPYFWLNEMDVGGQKGRDLFDAVTPMTERITVTVTDGKFDLYMTDFNAGEMLVVKSITEV